MKTQLLTLLILTLSIISESQGQEIFPSGITGSGGSYNLTFPSATCPGSGSANDPIGNNNISGITKTSNYPGAFQTHNWWNSALWNVSYYPSNTKDLHSDVMYPWPLMVQAVTDGMILRYRNKDYQAGANTTNCYTADQDLKVGLKNRTTSSTQVDAYGHWHVKMLQETGGGEDLYTTAAAGCPFAFFEKQGITNPLINGSSIKVIGTSSTYIGFTINPNPFSYPDVPYGLFFPSGSLVSVDGGSTFINPSSITAGTSLNSIEIQLSPGSNYFSIAVLPDATTPSLSFYSNYAFNFITDTDFSYSFDEINAKVTNVFTVTTTPKDGTTDEGTLQALYRHQYIYSSQFTSLNTGYTYMSPRGVMKVITGNSFTTELDNHGILPSLAWANTADKVTLYNLCTDFASTQDISNPSTKQADMYNIFILISEAARVAEIAHQVGNYSARDKCLEAARYYIEDRLSSPNGDLCNMVYYSPTFNWMTCYPSSFHCDAGMHDSHFIWGYLIYGAAIVARYEQKRFGNTNWITQWKPMIDLMIRNINDYNKTCSSTVNDPNTPCFPYLRYFDPYAGHSWALNYTESQESVSEAVQFGAGTMLWGEITGNTAMRDMGAMLFVNESEAGRQYWYDVDNTHANGGSFAPDYPYNHAGIVYTYGAAYACFFGTAPYQFHGITYWPISGASVWMGTNPAGAQRDYNDFLTAYGGNVSGTNAEDYWTSELLSYMSLYNGNGSLNIFNSAVLNNIAVFDRNADYKSHRINAYHWITTLDSVGEIDASVKADIAFYSVFTKDDCKHYMIYNPYNKPARYVTFTDGKKFSVPSDTLIVFKICNSSLPITLNNFAAEKSGRGAFVEWKITTEEKNVHYVLEKSKDGKTFEEVANFEATDNLSDLQSYSFFDPLRYIPVSYYRIKEITSNNINYTNVISLEDNNSIVTSEVFPNPTSGPCILYVNSISETKIEGFLSDLTGKSLKAYTLSCHAGTSEILIDLGDLGAGTYFLKLSDIDTGTLFIKKIIKTE